MSKVRELLKKVCLIPDEEKLQEKRETEEERINRRQEQRLQNLERAEEQVKKIKEGDYDAPLTMDAFLWSIGVKTDDHDDMGDEEDGKSGE